MEEAKQEQLLHDLEEEIQVPENKFLKEMEKESEVKENFSEDLQNPSYQSCLQCLGCWTGWLNTWICIGYDAPFRRIPEAHWAVVSEFGKFTKILPPGLHYLNPRTEDYVLVDRRERVLNLKKQSIITKDNVNIVIDAIVYYYVNDAYKATYGVSNMNLAIAEIAKTTLRDVFGHVMLQEAFEAREKMAELIKEVVDKPTHKWGVTVTRVLIQELIIPQDLLRGLSSAATAKREAEAKVILAQADVDSAKLMREASDALNTPAAMQIRYLDAISALGQARNTKVVFMPGEGKDSSTNVRQVKHFLVQTELI